MAVGSGALCGGGSPLTAAAVSLCLHPGVLLGAGSFGRVFKGRYHGQAVAVKVLTCLLSELPRVLREAEIAMQLDHPNLVRALRCLVQHSPHAAGSSSIATSSSRAGSSGPRTALQVCWLWRGVGLSGTPSVQLGACEPCSCALLPAATLVLSGGALWPDAYRAPTNNLPGMEAAAAFLAGTGLCATKLPARR